MAQEYKTEDKYEMVPYDETQLNEKLENLQGWERVDESPLIARTYKFDKYLDGVKLPTKLANTPKNGSTTRPLSSIFIK